MTAVYESVMPHYKPSRYTLQLFSVWEARCRQEKSISLLQCRVMPNQHSPHTALFHLFLFFHLRSHISIYPCWVDISKSQNQFGIISITGDPLNLHQWSGFGKQLPRCRTSVIWRESALTSLDAAEERPLGEGGGSEGRGAAESRPAALHKKTWGLMWRCEIGECWEGPKRNAPVTDTCKHTADMSKHTVGREVNKVSYSTELVFYITTLLSSPSPLQRNLYS